MTRLSRLVPLLAALLSLNAHSSARAQAVVLTTQERSVTAWADAPPNHDFHQLAASDMGPFDATISAHALSDEVESSGSARQTSTLSTQEIHALGSCGFAVAAGIADGAAAGLSKTVVSFVVQAPTAYSLHGTLSANSSNSRVKLTGPQGLVQDRICFYQSQAVNASGTLAPGAYTLEVLPTCQGALADPMWIDGSAAADITLTFSPGPVPAGEVPDGNGVPGDPLRITKLSGSGLRLLWSPSCRSTDTDYAVYESALGQPLDLAPVACSTSGQTHYELAPAFEASAFLVVPTNGAVEGSYGSASDGTERLPSVSACRPQLLGQPVCSP